MKKKILFPEKSGILIVPSDFKKLHGASRILTINLNVPPIAERFSNFDLSRRDNRSESLLWPRLYFSAKHVGVLQCGKTAGFDLGTRQSNYECTFHEVSSRARPLTRHKRWRRGLARRGRAWLCAGSRRR